MIYAFVAIVGMIAGAVCIYAILNPRLEKAARERERQEERATQLDQKSTDLQHKLVELADETSQLKSKQRDVGENTAKLRHAQAEFDRRVIQYDELRSENALLKRDLQNIDVNL